MKKNSIRILFLAINLMLFYQSYSQISRIDSLKVVYESSIFDMKKSLEALESLAQEYEENYMAIEAANTYQRAIQITRKINKPKKLAQLLFLYSSSLISIGDYKSALDAIGETNEILKAIDDDFIKAPTLMQLGIINFFMHNWDESLFFYNEALKLAIKMQSNKGISIAYNNIANIYQKKGDRKKAYQYYKKAYKIQKELSDSSSMANCLMNMASNLMEKTNYDHKKVLELLEQTKIIATKIGDTETLALTYMHLSILNNQNNKFEIADSLMNLGLSISLSKGYHQLRVEFLEAFAKIYEGRERYKDAIFYIREAQSLKDSLMSIQMLEKAKGFEIRYKSKEKDAEIALQKQALINARYLYISLGVILMMLLLFTVYLIYNNQWRKKKNLKLQKLINVKDRLFSIISHDLKSPAVAQKVASEMLAENFDKYDCLQVKEYLMGFAKSAHSQITLIENLNNWAKMEMGSIKFRPVMFDVNEILFNVIELHQIHAKEKHLKIQLEAPADCTVYADKSMIQSVFSNILDNGIKFSPSHQKVLVKIEKSQLGVRISIADKGIGISEEKIKELQKLYKGSISSSDKEIGKGLGMLICYEFLAKHNSFLEISSLRDKGTCMSFLLKNEYNND